MKKSKLWENLVNEKFSKIDKDFLSNFREPGNANNRLAAWDPFDKTMRYFKFLLFHQVQSKSKSFFIDYLKIGSTEIGNPVFIHGPSGGGERVKINLDHFFSIEETHFLKKNFDHKSISSVIEIGAGFGRTAQAIIRLFDNVDKYSIIDLPEVLSLSQNYLKQVLSDIEFSKIEFINAMTIKESYLESLSSDLVINIDSFQEMTEETIKFYFGNIIKNAKFFYSKNAIGKYSPQSIGLQDVNSKQILDVFSLGLSRDLIDIFDSAQLVKARKAHINQYCPVDFIPIANEPLGIFPYYLNVLYKRNSFK